MDQAAALLAALRAAAGLGGRLDPSRVEALAAALGLAPEELPDLIARWQEAKQVKIAWGGVLEVLQETAAGAGPGAGVVINARGASFGPGATIAGRDATGGHVGGTAPFGFRRVGAGRAARLEPVPEQQEAIATMRRLRGACWSLRALRAIAAAVHERHRIKVSHLAVRRALATEGASPPPDALHRVAREAAVSAPHPPRPARDDQHPFPRVSHLHGGSP